MTITSILIANRGEIAVRIARAAADMGLDCVCVFSEDDADSMHVRAGGRAHALAGSGAAAYLDAEQIISVARAEGCDAIHPGYGFLSENAGFAARCAASDLTFIGPTPETLTLLGDKAEARALAKHLGVPLLPGTAGGVTPEVIADFIAESGRPAMIKAVAGGGGRGMRPISNAAEVADIFERCRREAEAAFGDGALYAERLVRRARHVEVQVIGDGCDVVHAHERDCTLQRLNQKIVEIAPAPGLSLDLRDSMIDAALRMARQFPYSGLGTFEFLVDLDATTGEPAFFFMEANPRLQVEHTVTEEVTGLDLVATQIAIAAGRKLADLGLHSPPPLLPGYAVQLRINTETMTKGGAIQPQSGEFTRYEPPSGPGLRLDGYAYAGYRTNPRFDSLIAKVIVRSSVLDFAAIVARARRALSEFRIEGVQTNLSFLDALLARPEVTDYNVHTTFVTDHAADLLAAIATPEAEPELNTIGRADGPLPHALPPPDNAQPLNAPFRGSCAPSMWPQVTVFHTAKQLLFWKP